MESIFTTQKEIKERTIIENEFAFAFPDHVPIVPGHTLIAPKRVVLNICDLKPEEILGMFNLIDKLNPALRKVFNAVGFNYAWNEGEGAGQSVPHVHIHMLPRKEGDAGVLHYDPRQLLYRPPLEAPVQVLEEELQDIAKKIREHIS